MLQQLKFASVKSITLGRNTQFSNEDSSTFTAALFTWFTFNLYNLKQTLQIPCNKISNSITVKVYHIRTVYGLYFIVVFIVQTHQPIKSNNSSTQLASLGSMKTSNNIQNQLYVTELPIKGQMYMMY